MNPSLLLLVFILVGYVLIGPASMGGAQEVPLQGPLDELTLSTPPRDRENSSPSVEFIEALQKRQRLLEEREERIKREEGRLILLREDLKDMLAKSIAAREALENLNKKTQKEDETWNHLIKIYQSMAPEEAALRIEKMNEKIVLDLFSRMKGKTVGQILSFMNPSKAAKLSEKLAKKKGGVQKK